MSSTTTRHRAIRTGALAAAALLLLGPSQATGAAAQAAEPIVTVTATPGLAFEVTDCRGASDVRVTEAIQVTVHRTGDTTGPLPVALSYGGTLAATSELPTAITIPPGAAAVALGAAEAPSGTLTVSVVDGDGYAVKPSGAVTGVNVGVADLLCGIGNVSTTQFIEVGETPESVDVVQVAGGPSADLNRSVEGTAPPGLTFHPDGTWTGTATRVGDYLIQEYFCDDDGWCPNRADVRVVVVPAGEVPPPDPPTPAPAPRAASPVTGTPTLTG